MAPIFSNIISKKYRCNMSEIKRCTSCGTAIKFIKLESGKYNPVDAGAFFDLDQLASIDETLVNPEKIIVVSKSGKVGKLTDLRSGYLSHFSNCPNAKSYRKKEV